jgi:hypothetical protein
MWDPNQNQYIMRCRETQIAMNLDAKANCNFVAVVLEEHKNMNYNIINMNMNYMFTFHLMAIINETLLLDISYFYGNKHYIHPLITYI